MEEEVAVDQRTTTEDSEADSLKFHCSSNGVRLEVGSRKSKVRLALYENGVEATDTQMAQRTGVRVSECLASGSPPSQSTADLKLWSGSPSAALCS